MTQSTMRNSFQLTMVFAIAIHQAASQQQGCGRTSFSESKGVVTSPNHLFSHRHKLNCTYFIEVGRNNSLILRFRGFQLEPPLSDGNCTHDWLMVTCNATNDENLDFGKRMCGNDFPKTLLRFLNCPVVMVKFFTDASGHGTQFSIEYTVEENSNSADIITDEECGPTNFDGPTGIITSPRIPLSNPHDLNCVYYIDVDRTRTVKLSFQSFNLEKSLGSQWMDICSSSWLMVSCLVYGVPASASLYQDMKYCGKKEMPWFLNFSNCESLTLNFFARSSVSEGDFQFRYTVSTPGNATPDGARGNASFTGPTGFITSPGFPLSYPDNSDFTYNIEVNRTTTVGFFFYSFILEGTPHIIYTVYGQQECPYDWLSFGCEGRHSKSSWDPGYCGEKTEPLIRSIKGCEIAVTLNFISDSTVNSGGFKVWYTIMPQGMASCGNELYSAPSGIITSPKFPLAYPVNMSCTFSIDVGRKSTVLLALKHFQLEEPDSEGRCTNDWLLITCNGTTTENPNNGKKFCGFVKWSSSLRYVGCSSLVLEFVSGPSFATVGFLIEYTVTEDLNSTDEDSELECGTTSFTDSSGVINLPVNPRNYLATVNCTYTILTNHMNVIWLNFTITSTTRLLQSFQGCDQETLTVGCASKGETEVNPSRTRVYYRGGGSTPRREYEQSTFIFAECHTLKLSIRSNTYDNRETFSIPFAVYEPDDVCGNTLLSDPSGIIHFPRLHFQYPQSVNCVYTIDNSLVKSFVLTIDCLNSTHYSLSGSLTMTCVMVNGTTMAQRRLDRKPCSDTRHPIKGVVRECRRIIIHFPNRLIPSIDNAFHVRYRLGDNDLDCGTTLFTNASGVISFPINPSNTLGSVNCTYIISAKSSLSYIWLNTNFLPGSELLQSFQECDIESLTVGCVSEGGTELNPKTKKSICRHDRGSTLAKIAFANCSTLKLSILSRAYDLRRTFALPYSFVGPDNACGNTTLPTPSGVFTPPQMPDYYGAPVICLYTVDIGEVASVSLSLNNMYAGSSSGSSCSGAWLMITCLVNGTAMAHPLANRQLCGHMDPMTARFPACRTVHFSYFTDPIYKYTSKRFSLRYKAGAHVLDCGDTLFTNSSGVINLPSNTVGTPVTVNCTYTIYANQSSHIWLKNEPDRISSFFQSFQNCDKEILTVGCISEGETELNRNTTKVFCSRQGAYSNFPRTHLVFIDCTTLKLSIRSDEYTRQQTAIPFTVVRPSELCGNTSFSAMTGTVSSQRLPSHYPRAVNCLYVIESDHVDSVVLNIDHIPVASCDNNWLTISCLVNGTSMAHPMADRKICRGTNEIPTAARFSACSRVLLNFSTDSSAYSYESHLTVRYRIGEHNVELDCGDTMFTNSSGVIKFPVNPTNYAATVNCTYTISTNRSSHIWLNIHQGALVQFFRSFQDCDRDSATFGCVSEGETEMNPNTTKVFCHRRRTSDYLPTWSPVFIDCPRLVLSIISSTYDRPTISIPFTVFEASELCGNTPFSGPYGVITSPRLPQGCSKAVNCHYVIENDRVNTVVLNIDRLNVGSCNSNWLTITCLINETAMAHPMAERKLCGYVSPTVVRFPACLRVLLNFSSDYSPPYEPGFSIRYGIGGYDPNCGYTSHSGPAGFITSPQFPLPYAHGLNCSYSIAGVQRSVISLSFVSFSIEGTSSTTSVDSCCCDWMTVGCLPDADPVASSRKYCGVKTTPMKFSFLGCAAVVLNFRSDSSANRGGFRVAYVVRDIDSFCGVPAFGPPSGVISLPWNFTDFDVSIDCKYVINATESSSMSLTIWSISLQSSVRANCSRDWLLITPLNGQISTNVNMSHNSCENKNVSAQLTFPGCTAVQVLFHKDAETTWKTFRIEYTVTSGGTGASVSTTEVPSTLIATTEEVGTEETCATRCRLCSDSTDCVCLPDTSQTAAISISADNPVTQSPKCEVGCEISSDGTTCECSAAVPDTKQSEPVSVSTDGQVTRSIQCEVGCEISKDGTACDCSATHLADTLVDSSMNLSDQSGGHAGVISLGLIVLVVGAICVGAVLIFRRHRQKKQRSEIVLQATEAEDRAKMELLEAESTKTGLLYDADRNQGQDGSTETSVH